jgi:hypothetical protein
MKSVTSMVIVLLVCVGTAGADVIYDSLWIVDGREMDAASGNVIGGANGPTRQTTDAQIADDFDLDSPHQITVVVADVMSFGGSVPAEGVWVQFYAHDEQQNKPSEAVFADVVVLPGDFDVEEIDSPLQYRIYRITMDIADAGVVLGAGKWWVNSQPVDIDTRGDWFWYVGSVTIPTIGLPSHVRDGWLAHGNNYAPLWNSTMWIPHDFRGNNTLSMKIEGLAMGGCTREPAWVCDGDVDGNGAVNPVDAGLVQAAFCGAGECSDEDLCQYDLDCNAAINPVDAGLVQSLFGQCNAPRDVCP